MKLTANICFTLLLCKIHTNIAYICWLLKCVKLLECKNGSNNPKWCKYKKHSFLIFGLHSYWLHALCEGDQMIRY